MYSAGKWRGATESYPSQRPGRHECKWHDAQGFINSILFPEKLKNHPFTGSEHRQPGRIIAAQPAVTRADQATRDSIRVIVSTDVTATPTPPRASFRHDVLGSHEPTTSTALLVLRLSIGVATELSQNTRLEIPSAPGWISELFTWRNCMVA